MPNPLLKIYSSLSLWHLRLAQLYPKPTGHSFPNHQSFLLTRLKTSVTFSFFSKSPLYLPPLVQPNIPPSIPFFPSMLSSLVLPSSLFSMLMHRAGVVTSWPLLISTPLMLPTPISYYLQCKFRIWLNWCFGHSTIPPWTSCLYALANPLLLDLSLYVSTTSSLRYHSQVPNEDFVSNDT